MQVWILVETWGYDAPRPRSAFTSSEAAHQEQMRLPLPLNLQVWGPIDVVQ